MDSYSSNRTYQCMNSNDTDCNELNTVAYTISVTLFSVCFFFGVMCNLTVLIVYLQRMRDVKDDRSYIPLLAAADLALCVIISTQGLLETIFQGNISNLELCTMFTFTGQLLNLTSAFLVLSIAIQRHRKVCHPFAAHQKKPRIVKVLLSVVIVVLSSPVIIFSVVRSKDFVHCDRLGGMRSEDGPALYLTFLALVVTAIFIGTLFLYTKIEIEMTKRYKISKSIYQRHEETLHNKEVVDRLLEDANLINNRPNLNMKSDREVTETSFSDIHQHRISSKKVRFDAMDFLSPSEGKVQLKKISVISNDLSSNGLTLTLESEMTSMFNSMENILDGNSSKSNTLERKKKTKVQVLRRRKSRLGRFTFMYIIIVLVYSMTSLPVIVVRVFDLVPGLNGHTFKDLDLILSFLSNSFIIRSILNPFIYGCFDMKFRQNLSSILYWFKRS